MAEVDERNARLGAYGAELRRRRLDAGFRFANQFAARVGISAQYLSDLERGYSTPDRPAREPDDDVLEAITRATDWPKMEQIRLIRGLVDDSDIRPLDRAVVERYRSLQGPVKVAVDALLFQGEVEPATATPPPPPAQSAGERREGIPALASRPQLPPVTRPGVDADPPRPGISRRESPRNP